MIVYKYNHHIVKLFYRILNKFEPDSSVSSSPTHGNTLSAKENNEISELPGYVSPSARNVEIDAAESARGISKSELYQISIVFTLSLRGILADFAIIIFVNIYNFCRTSWAPT